MKISAATIIIGLVMLLGATLSNATPSFRRSLAADETKFQQQNDWHALLADERTRALAYIIEAADLIDAGYDDDDDEELLAAGGRRRALATGGRRRR